MKLFSQFEQVERATPFARRDEGNISEGIAHGTGPHDAPKPRHESMTLRQGYQALLGELFLLTEHVNEEKCHARPAFGTMSWPIA